ncbi:hypothetical protein [Streptomyces virginiae]|uniref:hypothetical protein n=1 Tax=Streptomyces virginiae TaxID=1961 RepID=UPI003799484F
MSATMDAAPGKPGPALGPIVETAGLVHRMWLIPMRDAYFASKLTTEEISEKSRCNGVKRLTSKGKVSELLRGAGAEGYPRWYRVLALHDVLSPSDLPLDRLKNLWIRGAEEAGRKASWIEGCLNDVKGQAGATSTGQPVIFPARRVLRARTVVLVVLSLVFTMTVGLVAYSEYLNLNNDIRSIDEGQNLVEVRAYIRVRPPTDTRNTLRVQLSRDVPVDLFSNTAVGRRESARAHDVLFLACRGRDDFLIAGTSYRVKEHWLKEFSTALPEDLNALPLCGTQEPSASTAPQG